MYIRMYVCMFMYVCMYIYIYTRVCMYICMYIRVYVCVCVYIYVCVYVCMCVNYEKDKLSLVHNMKAYRGSVSMALLILNFSAEVESSKPRPRRLPNRETNPVPIAQEAGRADSRCGRFAEDRNLIPMPGLHLCT